MVNPLLRESIDGFFSVWSLEIEAVLGYAMLSVAIE
jgi:hypothetical protein